MIVMVLKLWGIDLLRAAVVRQDSTDYANSMSTFFRFLSLDTKCTGLSLRAVSECGDSALDIPGFIKIQINLFNAWVDRVKNLSDDHVDKCLLAIPSHLWDAQSTRPGFQHIFKQLSE